MSKKTAKGEEQRVELDVNNPEFQAGLFKLEKSLIAALIGTFAKIAPMNWTQVDHDSGLKLEIIYRYKGPHGEPRYRLRLSKGFRGIFLRGREGRKFMSGHTHFDEATEEYLEAVYRLEREGEGATTSGLAVELGVAQASVSGMVKRLVGEGYLEQRARGEARLTEKGLAIAVRVMRRHRLAECFLVKMLGMGWEEVGPDACMLEHAISPRVEERLLAVLGNPSVCPHGHPIPSLDLSPPEQRGRPLATLEPGSSALMHAIRKKAPEVLLYLSSIGLVPGAPVEVLKRAPLDGPVTIAVGGTTHAISLELASAILVLLPAEASRA